MNSAEIHQQEGFQWSIDDEGTLMIEKAEGGDGVIHLEPIWEEYRKFDPMTDGYDTSQGIVGYRQPWFVHMEEIVQARVGDGIVEIPNEAFAWAVSLRSVSLPAGLKHIGRRAFIGCKNLRSVHLPDSLQSIGASAFSGCESLEDVALPNSLWNIGDEAFARCDSLKRLSIPAGVGCIGKGALDAMSLHELVLPRLYKDDKSIFHFIFPTRPQFNPRFRVRYVAPPKAPKGDADSDKPARSLFARLFGKG